MKLVRRVMSILLIIAMAAMMTLAGVTPASAQLADAPWPMFRHDPQHTGRSPFTGPEVPAEKWRFTSGDRITSSAAVGPDGTIFVGSWDNRLYAINPDGTLKWSFATGDDVRASPAIGADGTIYVGSLDHKIYAINPDGTEKWSFLTGGQVSSSPSIAGDGTIYVGCSDHKLYAVNPDGSLKWSFITGSYIGSSPAIGADGTIYVGSEDSKLYAVNPDGSLKWSFTTEGGVRSSPALGADGTIYVASLDNKLYAVNADGSVKWRFAAGSYVESSPAIGADGTIYFGAYYDGNLYAVNLDGSLKWSFAAGGLLFSSSPAIGGDGTIYMGSDKLYAISPDGTLKWSFTLGFCSPSLGADGTIYVGSRDGNLYAIGEAPLFLEQTLEPEQTATQTLTISNAGDADLTWSLTEDPAVDWLSETPTCGIVVPGDSQDVQVTFDSTGLDVGCYTTTLNIQSNHPWEPLVQVPVTLRLGECGLADTPWPMFRHDLQHTGRSPYTGPEVPLEKWSFNTGGRVYSSPAIGADGTIYIGSEDDKVYAINPDGTEKWSFNTGYIIHSSPAIGGDGTIYVGSWDRNLYAINPYGTLKWSFITGAGVFSSPAVNADGTIYVGSYGNDKLHAITPDRTQKWTFTTGDNVESSPAVGDDGTIYVGSYDNKLYAVNPDGTEKWSFTTSEPVLSSPAIGADGTIYVGSWDDKVYAINPDGSEKWSFTTGDEVNSSPAIGVDGTIYVGSCDDKLYAINPDGTEKWSFATGGNIFRHSPAIGGDGTIYIGSEDHKLYAINPDGTEKWSFATGNDVASSPAIGADGTIYVGSGSNLYAIGEAPSEVWVDDDYCDGCPNDGHTWGYDAFDKIQDGIDAVAGSIVHVAGGTYVEKITLKDGVKVLGAGADITRIDAGPDWGAVVYAVDVGPNTMVDGFTITNGWELLGGGIHMSSSSAAVSNNVIIGNHADHMGGGIFIEGSSPILANNVVMSNTAIEGGGIGIAGSSPTLTNNVIASNSAEEDGGGICVRDSSPTIINNTIAENFAATGGGVYSEWESSLNMVNCIIYGNGDNLAGEGYIVTYSDIEGGYPGEGNISTDPMFVDPAGGDYHLQEGSPCIDAGTDEGAPAEDIEGNPRPIDGDANGTAITDMGAYEYVPPPAPPPSEVRVVADPVSLAADGLATSVITATVKDQYGQLVADGTSVTFTTDHGTLESDTVTKTTVGGVATANLTSELSAETVIATVTATANGASGAAAVFFIAEGCPGVEECQTGIVCGCGKCKNTVGGMGDIDIDATGDHIITTAKYEDNPGGTPTFEATGDYYDVHLDDDAGVESLTLNFCPATPDTVIYFWSGTNWTAASDQGYSDGCVMVTVTDSTYPSLSDLTGLPFATATRYGPPVAVGMEVYLSNKIAVLAPWASLIAAIIVAAVLTRRRRRARS